MHRLLKSFPYNSPDKSFCQVGKAINLDCKSPRFSRGIYKIFHAISFRGKMGKKYIEPGKKCCCFFVKVRV